MVTRALRQAQQRRQAAVTAVSPFTPAPAKPAQTAPQSTPGNDRVVLYPDLSTAILRENLDAPARVYFLLRTRDSHGRGWFSLQETRGLLTAKGSPWRVVSRRQLHNLLRAGEGLFWEQSDKRIWLRSPARVAAKLGVTHLRGRAVSTTIAGMLGHIADVRAHLYAAYLSGRPHADMPIARETITAVTGVDERTQKAYEERTKTAVSANFCVGERIASDGAQACAWAHRGQGVFELTDKKGKQGAPGQKYLAWQLPNSYQAKHQLCPRGKQRRVNRELQVLLNKTAAGNSSSPENHQRRYYPHGGDAAKAYSKNPDPVYWRRTPGKGVTVWHELK